MWTRDYDVNGAQVSPSPTVRPSFAEAVYQPHEGPPPGPSPSIFQIHDPRLSPAPTVSPNSEVDLGDLIPEGPSGAPVAW
jgi:hypothetical protein